MLIVIKIEPKSAKFLKPALFFSVVDADGQRLTDQSTGYLARGFASLEASDVEINLENLDLANKSDLELAFIFAKIIYSTTVRRVYVIPAVYNRILKLNASMSLSADEGWLPHSHTAIVFHPYAKEVMRMRFDQFMSGLGFWAPSQCTLESHATKIAGQLLADGSDADIKLMLAHLLQEISNGAYAKGILDTKIRQVNHSGGQWMHILKHEEVWSDLVTKYKTIQFPREIAVQVLQVMLTELVKSDRPIADICTSILQNKDFALIVRRISEISPLINSRSILDGLLAKMDPRERAASSLN